MLSMFLILSDSGNFPGAHPLSGLCLLPAADALLADLRPDQADSQQWDRDAMVYLLEIYQFGEFPPVLLPSIRRCRSLCACHFCGYVPTIIFELICRIESFNLEVIDRN